MIIVRVESGNYLNPLCEQGLEVKDFLDFQYRKFFQCPADRGIAAEPVYFFNRQYSGVRGDQESVRGRVTADRENACI